MTTYARKQLLELDRAFAVLLFNSQDVTISSLCRIIAIGGPRRVAALRLYRWQRFVLTYIGAGLEYFWPGHCAAARMADIARAQTILALLT